MVIAQVQDAGLGPVRGKQKNVLWDQHDSHGRMGEMTSVVEFVQSS